MEDLGRKVTRLVMSLYTFPNATGGFDSIAVQVQTAVPIFSPMILVFVFFVVMAGGISRQKGRTGTADYPMWSVVGSLSMFVVALILSVISGFISVVQLVIVTVVTIFSGLWLFLDRRGGVEA